MAGISELPTVYVRQKQAPAWADDVVHEDGNLMVQDAPKGSGGIATLPRTANIKGQHHILSYLTPEEQQMLRDAGGGLGIDGTQVYGPDGVPAFPAPGDGADNDDSADGSPAGDGGGPMGGSDPFGGGGVNDTDGPSNAGTGVGGPGGPSAGSDPAAGSPAGDGGGVMGGAQAGPAAPAGPSGPTGIAAVDRAIGFAKEAQAGKYGSAAQAAAIGSMIGGLGFGGVMGAVNGVAQGIGSLTGSLAEALGGKGSTDSSVGDPSDNNDLRRSGGIASLPAAQTQTSAGTATETGSGHATDTGAASTGALINDVLQMYGAGDLYGDDADVFLANFRTNPEYRKAITDAWGTGDQFWSNLETHLGKMGRAPNAGAAPTAQTPTAPSYPEGWDEDAFLASNPDVAAVVSRGDYPSGYSFDQAFRRFAGNGWADRATAARDPRWSPDVWDQFRERNGRRQAVDVNTYYYG